MVQITINTLSGTSPFSIFVCSTFLTDCTFIASGITQSSLPYEVKIPTLFENSPAVLVRVIDSSGCTEDRVFSCVTETTTPTPTITPTLTPSITTSISVTPSVTTSNTTPTPTSTSSPTPTVTSTITPTPTITPSTTPQPPFTALFLIEPLSASTGIGNYMYSKGLSFLGFSNGTSPTLSSSVFNVEMNNYLDYTGWTNNELYFLPINVASTSTGVDSFNNKRVIYNFLTQGLIGGTIKDECWWTVLIPTGLTNNYKQSIINIGEGSSEIFSQVRTDSTIFNQTFTYTGYNFNRTTYRVYTTFPSVELFLDNTELSIYLKGGSVIP
jgi:hypothetical protein